MRAALPAVILILLTLGLKSADGTVQDWPAIVLGQVGAGAVVPLTALLVGTSVLGSEIDDNSVLHLLATPVSRRAVIVSKTAVSAAVTFLFAAVPVLVAGVIAQSGAHALALGCFLGSALGALVYSCLFVMISAALRHPVIYALAYVALWEELISNLVSGAKYLSIEQWSLGVAHAVSPSAGLNAHLTITPSLVLAALAVIAVPAYAGRRLSGFTVRAD